MIAYRRMLAGALFGAAFAIPAMALEKSVTYNSRPLLSLEGATSVCQTFKPNQDRKDRVLRFICTRKLLYVCNREVAYLSSDPEAAGICFTHRAHNSD